MNEQEKLTIGNLAKGVVNEQFETELEKVLNNILDPNTDQSKTRKITITLEIKPSNSRRNLVNVLCQAKSTLVPEEKVGTELYIGKDKEGKIQATELSKEVFGQLEFDDQGVINETGKVTNFKAYQK